jgi:hypothetical protein
MSGVLSRRRPYSAASDEQPERVCATVTQRNRKRGRHRDGDRFAARSDRQPPALSDDRSGSGRACAFPPTQCLPCARDRPMTQALAPDLRDAVVRVCGEAFHFYGTLRPVFVAAGVSGELFDAVRENSNSKYVLCRTILAELDGLGESGRQAQHQMVRQLTSMREPMADAPDQDKGRKALADLRRLAGSTFGATTAARLPPAVSGQNSQQPPAGARPTTRSNFGPASPR